MDLGATTTAAVQVQSRANGGARFEWLHVVASNVQHVTVGNQGTWTTR